MSVRELIVGGQSLVSAKDFFKLLKYDGDFLEWMYRRVIDFDMRVNEDFFIYFNVAAVKELSKTETFKSEVLSEWMSAGKDEL